MSRPVALFSTKPSRRLLSLQAQHPMIAAPTDSLDAPESSRAGRLIRQIVLASRPESVFGDTKPVFLWWLRERAGGSAATAGAPVSPPRRPTAREPFTRCYRNGSPAWLSNKRTSRTVPDSTCRDLCRLTCWTSTGRRRRGRRR